MKTKKISIIIFSVSIIVLLSYLLTLGELPFTGEKINLLKLTFGFLAGGHWSTTRIISFTVLVTAVICFILCGWKICITVSRKRTQRSALQRER
jgi:hypothetical protein